jgi:hypothetical protein
MLTPAAVQAARYLLGCVAEHVAEGLGAQPARVSCVRPVHLGICLLTRHRHQLCIRNHHIVPAVRYTTPSVTNPPEGHTGWVVDGLVLALEDQ